MDDEEAELRNPFPSPPSHYTNYTTHNLKLLELLRERSTSTQEGGESSEPPDLSQVNQHEALSDQTDVPEWPLQQLEKPRVDWILEEGHYTVFGDTWFVKDVIPSLGEQGGQQFYPSDPSVDRRPALLTILRSLLVSYSRLLDTLLAPPPAAPYDHPPEWRKHVEWITIMAQNIMAAANDLRPVQARANLETMMRRQLELRREETKSIHEKCDALEAKLEAMRSSIATSNPSEAVAALNSTVSGAQSAGTPAKSGFPDLTQADVLSWAEEIG
ncbi:Mediator of RNA polymerase II transcription subunit 7 [Steccherinum ochraceum]|uniref:Mediator of RNA polymerase II transcription subunit 7 n=1 Tax=Steccherinum ochraceum TaxID=92696 RepID=A0A4R0R2B9_9APHY|nr:Mediator of RNA polymerase II transcription subunit 7 [Steccherinum ochraceum]